MGKKITKNNKKIKKVETFSRFFIFLSDFEWVFKHIQKWKWIHNCVDAWWNHECDAIPPPLWPFCKATYHLAAAVSLLPISLVRSWFEILANAFMKNKTENESQWWPRVCSRPRGSRSRRNSRHFFYKSVTRTTMIYWLLGPRSHSMLAVKNAEFSIHFAVSFLLWKGRQFSNGPLWNSMKIYKNSTWNFENIYATEKHAKNSISHEFDVRWKWCGSSFCASFLRDRRSSCRMQNLLRSYWVINIKRHVPRS